MSTKIKYSEVIRKAVELAGWLIVEDFSLQECRERVIAPEGLYNFYLGESFILTPILDALAADLVHKVDASCVMSVDIHDDHTAVWFNGSGTECVGLGRSMNTISAIVASKGLEFSRG